MKERTKTAEAIDAHGDVLAFADEIAEHVVTTGMCLVQQGGHKIKILDGYKFDVFHLSPEEQAKRAVDRQPKCELCDERVSGGGQYCKAHRTEFEEWRKKNY